MTYRKVREIVCDYCGYRAEKVETKGRPLPLGWGVVFGKHMCPACAKSKLGIKRPVKKFKFLDPVTGEVL